MNNIQNKHLGNLPVYYAYIRSRLQSFYVFMSKSSFWTPTSSSRTVLPFFRSSPRAFTRQTWTFWPCSQVLLRRFLLWFHRFHPKTGLDRIHQSWTNNHKVHIQTMSYLIMGVQTQFIFIHLWHPLLHLCHEFWLQIFGYFYLFRSKVHQKPWQRFGHTRNPRHEKMLRQECPIFSVQFSSYSVLTKITTVAQSKRLHNCQVVVFANIPWHSDTKEMVPEPRSLFKRNFPLDLWVSESFGLFITFHQLGPGISVLAKSLPSMYLDISRYTWMYLNMSCHVSPLVWEDMIPQMPPGNLPIKLLSGFEPSTLTLLWTWDKGDTENHPHTNSKRLCHCQGALHDSVTCLIQHLLSWIQWGQRGLNYTSTTKQGKATRKQQDMSWIPQQASQNHHLRILLSGREGPCNLELQWSHHDVILCSGFVKLKIVTSTSSLIW